MTDLMTTQEMFQAKILATIHKEMMQKKSSPHLPLIVLICTETAQLLLSKVKDAVMHGRLVMEQSSVMHAAQLAMILTYQKLKKKHHLCLLHP